VAPRPDLLDPYLIPGKPGKNGKQRGRRYGGGKVLSIAFPMAIVSGLAAVAAHCLPYLIPSVSAIYAKTRLPEVRSHVLWFYRLGMLPPYAVASADDPCSDPLELGPEKAAVVGWETFVIQSSSHTVSLFCVVYKAVLTAILAGVSCCRAASIRTHHAGTKAQMFWCLSLAGCGDVLLTLAMLLSASATLSGTGGDQEAVPPNPVLLICILLDSVLVILFFGVRAVPAYPRLSWSGRGAEAAQKSGKPGKLGASAGAQALRASDASATEKGPEQSSSRMSSFSASEAEGGERSWVLPPNGSGRTGGNNADSSGFDSSGGWGG